MKGGMSIAISVWKELRWTLGQAGRCLNEMLKRVDNFLGMALIEGRRHEVTVAMSDATADYWG